MDNFTKTKTTWVNMVLKNLWLVIARGYRVFVPVQTEPCGLVNVIAYRQKRQPAFIQSIFILLCCFGALQAHAQSINTFSVSGSPFCAGGSISVTFGTSNSNSFNNSNDFTVELSDGSGSFTTATLIGTITNNKTGGTVNGTISASAGTGAAYRVRITANSPPTSKTSTNSLTINALPALYSVTGGGAYCTGGTGVVVGLSDSDIGINYQLKNGGTNVGSAVIGTGSSISFGLQTTATTFTVLATRALTTCTQTMSGSAIVTITPIVGTPSTPSGTLTLCQGSSPTAYTTSATNATSYTWSVTGTGNTIAGTGITGTVTWAAGYSGTATVSVSATGCGTSSIVNRTVTINALPTLYSVTGGGVYCTGGTGVVVGLSDSDIGVSYQLKNGAANVGSPVNGTGNAISFGLQTTATTFTVLATNTSTTCAQTMSGSAIVTITPTVGTPSAPSGTLTRCIGSGSTAYTTSATNATTYTWSVTGTGNTIAGTGTTGTVTWAAGFSGTATVSVVANGCGTSSTVNTSVTVTPTVGTPSAPSGTLTRCQASGSTAYTTSATNATSYTWSVTGTGNTIAGTGTTGTVTWAAGYSGTATVSVVANGCGTSSTVNTSVTVTPTAGTPSAPSGTLTRCQASGTDAYTTSATNATSYTWSVTGTGNTIAGTGTTGTVTWAAGFSGTATVSVVANGCGTSSTGSTSVFVAAPNAITTSALASSTLCVGSTINVDFIAPCSFDSDNTFTAQLSSATGSFASPVNLGTVTGTTSGSISALIPAGIVAAGTQYRIRVVGNEPVSIGSDNGTDLTIQVYSAAPVLSQSIVTSGTGSTGTVLTATGTGVTSYQWGYYTVLGGSITNLGSTISTYTPQGANFPSPGCYYVVCQMQTAGAGCGLAVSNAVTVYVNCAQGGAANLIVNGNFEVVPNSSVGSTSDPVAVPTNLGFTSQYAYANTANSLANNTDGKGTSGGEGKYGITDDPAFLHSAFCKLGTTLTASPNGGKMLVGNAATSGSQNLWNQLVTVSKNTDYVLTFWAVSLAGPANSLKFGIYAGCFRTGSDIEVEQAGIPNCTWTQFTIQLNSGNQTSIDLAIRNISATAGGNDIAIDGIVMYACAAGSSNFPVSNTYIWRGFSSDWTSFDNWGSSCAIPVCGDAITIPVLPAGKIYPAITSTVATASTINISNGATLSVNAGANLTICGDFTNNGSLNVASTGTITLSNNKTPRTAQIIAGNLSGLNMFNNLTINNTTATDVVQLANPIELTGNLTITSGVLNANGKQIKLAGNFVNSSSFVPGTGTVEFRGANAQQITQTGTGQFYDFKINKSTATGTLTFNSAVTTINNQLILTKGIAVTGNNEIYVANNAGPAITGHTPAVNGVMATTTSNSYINGNLRRAVFGTRSYDYPVGDATRYELMILQINVDLGVSSVVGTFHSSNPAAGQGLSSADGSNNLALCTGGSWDITPNVTAASTARYKLYVFPVGFSCAGGGTQTFIKRHDSGSPWSMDGSTYINGNTRDNLKTFSEIVPASGTLPLPVRLLNFEGKLATKQVEVDWRTASELNNAYFEVQRSVDAKHFEAIGRVEGSGTTHEMRAYNYVDTKPLAGMNYYRLRQVDIDGKYEYSRVIAIDNPQEEMELFPNPISKDMTLFLRINSLEMRQYLVLIYDLQGKEVSREMVTAKAGIIDAPISQQSPLSSGTYLVRVVDAKPSVLPSVWLFKLMVN
ncbi:MAG: T9SS type A sorting domain-containing protein [Bacteroidota bacterium]